MASTFIDMINIAESCDYRVTRRMSSTDFKNNLPKKRGDSLYVYPGYLDIFTIYYLQSINADFVLVTGDEDTAVPVDIPDVSKKILSNPYLLCWYAQNCVTITDKLKQIPIGFNFFSLALGEISNWGPRQSVRDQEEDIFRLVRENKGTERIKLCYGNFHLHITNPVRTHVLDTVPKELVYYEPDATYRINMWSNMIKYKFVLSPFGGGFDCHRTYEAIALGCIPIIQSSPLDPLYEGLPVIIVNDWSEVTRELLDKEYNYNMEVYPEKMYLQYWIDKINHFKTDIETPVIDKSNIETPVNDNKKYGFRLKNGRMRCLV
jgi:hypothetical protein